MKISAYSFLTALKAVLPFAAKNDVRYCLNGVHLLGTQGGFFMEATDGHTAARVKIDGELDGPLDLVVPRGYCEKLIKLKVPARERDVLEVEFCYSPCSVVVSLDGQKMEGNPVDCKYVDLARILGAPPRRESTRRPWFQR